MSKPADGIRAAGGAGARGWAVRILCIVVALTAIWLSARNALHGLMENDYPELAMAITPPSAPAELTIALNRVARDEGVVDEVSRALSRDALRRAPLSAEPLVVAALDASARDQPARARQLFEEARRRDPRSIVSRYWLFDYDLRNGDYALGMAEAAPLMRLQSRAASAITTVLTALIDLPAARPALVTALRGDPIWREGFFQQVSAIPRLRGEAAALLQQIGGAGSGGDAQDEQRAVIQSLVRDGEIDRARALWLQLLPAADRAGATGIYDGDFAGKPGTLPFNWRIAGSRDGIAQRAAAPETAQRTGLAIRFSGDRAALLAEQMVVARPGAYRLSFAAKALDGEPSTETALRATVQCAGHGKPLARSDVQRFANDLAAHDLDFTMPATCKAALVQFSVVPGIMPGPLDVLLTDVRLAPR